MENIILKKPDITMDDEIMRFRKEFLDAKEDMPGCSFLKKTTDTSEWLKKLDSLNSKTGLPQGMVPSEQYVFVRQSDNRVVGMIQFRREFNEKTEKYFGNIGYSVRPSERRKGYAKAMLKAIVPLCKNSGLKNLLITCNSGNIGSQKTILANGGVFESDIFFSEENDYLKRYHIAL